MRINQYSQYINNYRQTSVNDNKYADAISFGVKNPLKPLTDAGTDALAYGFGKLASYKPVQSLVKYLKNKNYEEHLAAFVGCVISASYMMDTARSKKIEKDQKMPLIMNQGIVCGLSTIGAYTLNRYLNKKLNGLTETFHISQIKNNELQKEFLQTRVDYEYVNQFKEKLVDKPVFKNIFANADSKFEFNNTIKVYIKEALKKHPDDNVAKAFLQEIKNAVPTETQDKSDIIKQIFLAKKGESKTLQNAYDRSIMNTGISNYAAIENFVNTMSNRIEAQVDVKKFTNNLNKELKSNPNNSDLNAIFNEFKKISSIDLSKRQTEYQKFFDAHKDNSLIKSIANKSKKTLNIKNVSKYIKAELAKEKDPSKVSFVLKDLLSEIENFKSITEAKEFMKSIQNIRGGKLTTMMSGFRIARALMVFALIYRFVSPVFATPLANKISEKLENSKKAA